MIATKRGKVLRGTGAGPGLLTVGGRQHTFVLEGMWQSEEPPQPGMTVDVDFDAEGAPLAIRGVSDNQLAKEQAAASLADAREKGGQLATSIVARFGKSSLIAEGLLVLGWFFLAFLTFRVPYAGRVESRTLWQILSYLGSGNPVVALSGGGEGAAGSGLYSLLGAVALAGPFLSFIWKDRRAVLGNLLPLGFMVGLAAMTLVSIEQAMPPSTNRFAYEAAQESLSSMLKALSLGLGAYLSIAVSMYFAFQGVKAFLLQKAKALV